MSDASPIIAPEMITVSELFNRESGLYPADKVSLLMELYDCYSSLNPRHETLDDFMFWGDVILSDFNDVDKYLADPRQVFMNISDLKDIQDDFSYLTDAQRTAIETFVSHFSDRSGRLTVDLQSEDPGVKERFLHIWNILYPLYELFNRTLRSKGMAYEGMIYRSIAESDVIRDDTSYVFVGLNALNECERNLLRRLRDSGQAEFCWDWAGEMIRDPRNRSSFFMTGNLKEFPQAFKLEEEVSVPSFNVLSVPSSYGQVKHVSSILEKVGFDACGKAGGSDTAIVLPDEGLLVPLLNSIPENVPDINVTMGYPMSACRLKALMTDIARLQLGLRNKNGIWHYYHKQVWDILSCGLMRSLLSGEDMKDCREKVEEIRKEGRYFISQESLSGYPILDMIFRPVVQDMTVASSVQTDSLASYLQDVAAFIAGNLADDPDMSMELEFARAWYNSINSLRTRKLEVLPSTFIRLLDSFVAGMTLPFKGEPLKGLQIMGPLETRALDFRNVIVLSCNEGMFPRRNVSSSFVPPELRKTFGLPTYEYQDAIWAYYFYRLVSRAENVWLVYDSRTEGLKRGEESRYIKQLRYHFNVGLNYYIADSGLVSSRETDDLVEKTDEMMDTIENMCFSASSIQNYVICPARFCYHSVLNLNKDKDVAESLDSSMIGNVFHNVMWALYHGEEMMMYDGAADKLENGNKVGMERVSKEYLIGWLERESDIKAKVVSCIKNELKTDEVSGRDLVVQNVIVRYVMETVRKDILLLDMYGADGFDIIGLEKNVSAYIHGAKFFGVMDRIDSLAPGMVRLSDYKSGSDSPSVIAVTDDNADVVVNKIFDGDYKNRKSYKAALQFHIYDRMLSESGLAGKGEQIFNTMYSTSAMFKSVPAVIPTSAVFSELMDKRLERVLDEIRDRSVPFRKADDKASCEYCDYKMICGR